MKWRLFALKVLLSITCTVNVILGLIAFFSTESFLPKTVSLIYGINLTSLESQAVYVVKMLGCFLMAIGVMSGLAVRDPARNKVIVYGNIVWLLMRVAQRLLFAKEIHETLNVSYVRILSNALFVFIIASLLFWLRPKEKE